VTGAGDRGPLDDDALLIASPESAHGVTGTIKNVFDWLVGFELFVNRPVAILNTSPRAHHADEALREILRTMSALIVEEASVSIPWWTTRRRLAPCAAHSRRYVALRRISRPDERLQRLQVA
jgi:hypothetical protein